MKILRSMMPTAGLRLGCAGLLAVAVAACGGSDSNSSPPPPVSVIGTADGLADVGSRVLVSGDDSFDPTGQGLEFFWSLIRPSDSETEYEDHCEDVPPEVCTANDDTSCEDAADPCDVDAESCCATNADCDIPDECDQDRSTCVLDQTRFCRTNADCTIAVECDQESGTVSSQCSEGPCNVNGGQEMEFATFIADVPGPFTVRLLTQASNSANDVGTRVIRTNPSLFLIGSLVQFGGTGGALVGLSGDAEIFAPGAQAGAASTVDGNLLLAVPSPPLIREFDFRTGDVVGTFGETSQFSDIAVALTFDEGGVLWVAYENGLVRRFDGANGLFIDEFADVTGPGQSVSAIAVSPDSANLLVADPTPAAGIREYARSNGSFAGVLGDTATAVGEGVDLAFQGDPAAFLLIADGVGDVIRCNTGGTACASLGAFASALAGARPSSIAVNPSAIADAAAIVVGVPSQERVLACGPDGLGCADFGETLGFNVSYSDVVFAPTEAPTTTTTTLFGLTTSTTVTTSLEASATTLPQSVTPSTTETTASSTSSTAAQAATTTTATVTTSP